MRQTSRKGFWSYETMLMVLLSLNFGIVFFDRNAMSYLAPFVKPDLGLSNEQIGLLASGLSFAWAISGFVIGTIADRTGHRKVFLVVAVIMFSLCSVVSGLAGSFIMLFAARMVMGVAEGPLMPISQSFAAAESSPERRGLNMGFVQNFGSNLIGTTVASIAIVALANAVGWRVSFFIAAIPGLLSAALLWMLVREPKIERKSASEDQERMPIREMLRYGRLTPGQARPLVAVADTDRQLQLAEEAVAKGLTARALESLAAKGGRSGGRHRRPRSEPDSHTRELTAKLSESFRTRVDIVRGRRVSEIRIHFQSEQELIAIYARLKR